MSGMQQEPGFDTSVETFVPFRSAPVYRRVVRKYHCQENLSGTGDFNQMTFKVHNENPNLVCNECRLVMPLKMRALDEGGRSMNMRVSDGDSSCNVAISENPFTAFKVIDTSINGKGYSEMPNAYGNMLSKCYSSVSEMSWQNNHSLKPIVNTNRINNFQHFQQFSVMDQYDNETNDYVEVFGLQVHKGAFVAEQLNSGFLERSRMFQQGLKELGVVWDGNISTLLNTALWSNEARGQGNIQIPYLEDLFQRYVFNTNQCVLDTLFGPTRDPSRIIAQSLFEFLTPFNAAMPGSDPVVNQTFAKSWYMQWTGDPYLQIEWVEYQEMLPIYRLRGFRYQLVKSQEVDLPILAESAAVQIFKPLRVLQECLAVPNKVYCWAELSESSARNSFVWGGCWRTCDLKNVNVRVNGHAHIIADPDQQSIMYKWFKRNTNSTHEYPVWNKQKVFVFTPTEVGLNQWLESDAQLSTLEVSAEIGLSQLQVMESALLDNQDLLAQTGFDKTHSAWFTTFVDVNKNEPNTFNFYHSRVAQQSMYWPSEGQENIGVRLIGVLGDNNHFAVPPTSQAAQALMSDFKLRNVDPNISQEIVSLGRVRRNLLQYTNCIWFRYNLTNGTIENNAFWWVPESWYFEFTDGTKGFEPLSWGSLVWKGTGDGQTTQYLELDAYLKAHPSVIMNAQPACQAFDHQDISQPSYDFNHTAPNILGGSRVRCAPGPTAFEISMTDDTTHHAKGVEFLNGTIDVGHQGYAGVQDGDNTRWCVMALRTADSSKAWVHSLMNYVDHSQNAYVLMSSVTDAPTIESNLLVKTVRGYLGSEQNEYNANNSSYEFHIPYTMNDVTPHLKYELNVLLEYSNSQVLMSKTREIPIHVSNLVPKS